MEYFKISSSHYGVYKVYAPEWVAEALRDREISRYPGDWHYSKCLPAPDAVVWKAEDTNCILDLMHKELADDLLMHSDGTTIAHQAWLRLAQYPHWVLVHQAFRVLDEYLVDRDLFGE